MTRILVIEGESKARDLAKVFPKQEYQVIKVHTSSEALRLLGEEEIDVVIVEAKPSDVDDLEIVGKLRALNSPAEVIVLTGGDAVDDMIKFMKLGVSDCLHKRTAELLAAVKKACDAKFHRNKTAFSPERQLYLVAPDDELVGESRKMREVKRLISLVSTSTAPVLILGETGTGKELVARAIHKASHRSRKPFVPVNASALPENILESELFGYKRGAFTGANSDKAGLLEVADQGTFFADEIGDICPAIQAKLLRVIETGAFRKLGDTREIRVNVRLVSATNKDLEEESRKNSFRKDLFYRLSTFVIRIPPLRERREDIPLLIDHILSRVSRGEAAKHISSETLDLLVNYSWPGNVRELANVLERAVLFSAGDTKISLDDLPLIQDRVGQKSGARQRDSQGNILLEDVKRQHIEYVLGNTNGNKSAAARLLGISRASLYRALDNR